MGRISMSRRFIGTRPSPDSPDDGRPAPIAGRPVRLSTVGWAQAGSLAALVGALVVVTSEPKPRREEATTWTMSTRHPEGVRALVFAPDGRRLATGGIEGDVDVYEVGQGVEKEVQQ